jgi:hypothetical protein
MLITGAELEFGAADFDRDEIHWKVVDLILALVPILIPACPSRGKRGLDDQARSFWRVAS